SDDAGTMHLDVVPVTEAGAAAAGPAKLSRQTDALAVSPDGQLGFIVHSASASSESAPSLVDVIDLKTFKTRNTITLTGASAPSSAGQLTMNADGSEIYLLDSSNGTVHVIDTTTGKPVRQIETGLG